ncbi:MAG: hypothetical protein AAGG51_16605 [Cyanobacteria bacterium P01_G01_bin.54]
MISLSIASYLVGLLSTEVSQATIRKVLAWLRDRTGGQRIELEVSYEKDGKKRKVTIRASNEKDLQEAIKAVQTIIDEA